SEYDVDSLELEKVIRVNFRLGFRVQPRIGVMLRKVAEEMASCGEIPKAGRPRDFKFVILERFLSYDNEFSAREGFILNTYFSILRLARGHSLQTFAFSFDDCLCNREEVGAEPDWEFGLGGFSAGAAGARLARGKKIIAQPNGFAYIRNRMVSYQNQPQHEKTSPCRVLPAHRFAGDIPNLFFRSGKEIHRLR